MDIVLSIAGNGALLLSLTFLYSLLLPYNTQIPTWLNSMLTGLLFGGFAVLNMLEPIRFVNGVIVDPRNVILMVAAMVGGLRAGTISLGIVTLYRAYLGGDGFWVGWASMFTASLLGLVYQRYHKKIVFDRLALLMGLMVGLESLLWTLALPNGKGWELMPVLALPVLLIYPTVSYVLIWLIASAYQRIELSAALQESESRFRAIFEQSLQYLCLLDADGIIRSVSPSLVTASRLETSQIIGKDFWQVEWRILPEHARKEIKAGIAAAEAGTIKRISLDLSVPERPTILDISFQKIAETGQILLEARDISQQVMGEKRRLELEFERERNDILQQLIGDASHHLRTPLSIINSSLYLLRKQSEQDSISPEIQSKMAGHLKKLDTARQDLVEIVEDLLSMMQLDSPAAFRFEHLQLIPYVNEIIETYYALAEEKQISLQYEKVDTPLLVALVPATFRRVIANLVENALRYTPAGGKITVRLCQNGQMAEISVEDTGIGIPAEDLPRIFDRFFRAKNASSQSLKGTGLGLAIVKKTVDLHKGKIEIQSTVGQGTGVTVRLPLLETSALAAS